MVLSTRVIMWIGHCKEIQKLMFWVLVVLWSESYEGLTLETSAFESLCAGQFTLTQLIKPYFLCHNAQFIYINVLSPEKQVSYYTLTSPKLAISLQQPLYFEIVPKMAALRRGSAQVTVLIGLSHLSITRGFLRPQNCYRICWNITARNIEIFFSKMKRQLAISE